MSMFYKLDAQGNPIEVGGEAWPGISVVVRDVVGEILISTVFLGINHNYGEGPPILWETMVFGTDGEIVGEYQERYSSREDALAGHQRAMQLATEGAKSITATPKAITEE